MSEMKPDGMGELFSKLAEQIAKTKNVVFDEDIKYPITVEKFTALALRPEAQPKEVGSFVSVRLASKTDTKTYLGIYLGDFPVGQMTSWNPDTSELQVFQKRNPAMFVPDLKRIVWGMESWWGHIEDENDLKQITDQDIENVWYVKALKSLTKTEVADA